MWSYIPYFHFNTTLVWVQSGNRTKVAPAPTVFQYNSCMGSIEIRTDKTLMPSSFQYNSCMGSIVTTPKELRVDNPFQYNSCMGLIIQYSCESIEV